MIKMYVVTHKESNFLPVGRTFIGVGDNKSINNVQTYDYIGDNISVKNSFYCELTALYWIWKNDNSDFISFEHYRRFFYKKTSFFWKNISTPKYILNKLKKHDIVVSNLFYFNVNLEKYYGQNHIHEDLDRCKKIIEKYYPEYSFSYNKVMNNHCAFMCNMFAMSKELLNDYCDWLFGILFKLENEIDLNDRDKYQQRVYGFISERLFNVWVDYKKLKICYLPIYMPKDIPFLVKFKRLIKKIVKK